MIVELKAAKAIESAHDAQLLDYLRAGDLEIGLPLTFGPSASFRRLVFSSSRRTRPRSSR